MLRIYCLQQWYNLSDPGAEEALYDIQSMRAFCNLELGRDPIPDGCSKYGVVQSLNEHELTKTVFDPRCHINPRLAVHQERGGQDVYVNSPSRVRARVNSRNQGACWRRCQQRA